MEPQRQTHTHGIVCYQIKSHMECEGLLLFCVVAGKLQGPLTQVL
jgi:hypothetical protein